MDGNVIFVKTVKASEEIGRRSYGLPQRLRRVLILVDGVRTADDLRQLAESLGDVDAFLAQLAQEGFIECQGGRPVALAGSAQLNSAREYLAEFVRNLLGDEAEVLLAQIVSCEDAASLRVCVDTCAELVQSTAGATHAEEFRTLFEELLVSA